MRVALCSFLSCLDTEIFKFSLEEVPAAAATGERPPSQWYGSLHPALVAELSGLLCSSLQVSRNDVLAESRPPPPHPPCNRAKWPKPRKAPEAPGEHTVLLTPATQDFPHQKHHHWAHQPLWISLFRNLLSCLLTTVKRLTPSLHLWPSFPGMNPKTLHQTCSHPEVHEMPHYEKGTQAHLPPATQDFIIPCHASLSHLFPQTEESQFM